MAAVQFELDDAEGAAMELWPCQSGEIVCVANHDVDITACLPFLIGKVYQILFLAFGGSVNKSERSCAISVALSIDVTTLIVGDWRVA